jgi:hypothetical protein
VKRIPTPLVLALASAFLSVGGIAIWVSQRGNEITPAERSSAQVRIDASTPERAAESFLDAWRKREFDRAQRISIGEARAAVEAKIASDNELGDGAREEYQQIWATLAADRLRFLPEESENMPNGRLALRGVAQGDFAGRDYRRVMEFILVQQGDHWVVEEMTPGAILSDIPDILEVDPGAKAGVGEMPIRDPGLPH